MKSDDELLDEITAYLRHDPVAEMPDVFVHQSAVSARRWAPLAAAALALAASLVAMLWWRSAPEPGITPLSPTAAQPARQRSEDADIVVLDRDLVQPLIRIEAGLDWIDMELAQLRRDAALLNARRKADELLAQF